MKAFPTHVKRNVLVAGLCTVHLYVYVYLIY